VQEFTDKFTAAFLDKNEVYREKEAQVKKLMQPLLQEFKNLAERLKINEKKDSNLQKEVKTFLRGIISGKLSKRDGDRLGMPVFPLDWNGSTEAESFRGFREWGFLSDAVLNILALLGWNDGTEQEIYSLEEMIQAFSMERVSTSGARFNFEKAKWFNKQYLAKMDDAELVALVKPVLDDNGVSLDPNKLNLIASVLKLRINYTTDFYAQGKYFFGGLDLNQVVAKHEKNLKKKILNKWTDSRKGELDALLEKIEEIQAFDAANLEAVIEPLIEDNKGEVLPIFRLGLSGEMGGPSIYNIMEVLGKEETLKRLTAFIAFCEEKLSKVDS